MATKYFMNGGVNLNWATDSNWSTTASAGPNNTTHGVAGDAVIIDSGSPSCTVAAAAVCDSINCTGYTGTLTVNSSLTVHGAITLGAGMSSGGTSVMLTDTSATLTSNGHTWGARFSCRGTSQTFTLADDWHVSAAFDAAGTFPTLNGNNLYCAGLTMSPTGTIGTTNIILTGGTWSGNNSCGNNLSLAGNVTVSGAVTWGANAGGKTLTYTSGTITTTGSTLTLGALSSGNSCTLNTNGITWNEVVAPNCTNGTTILNSLLSAGVLTVPAAAAPIFSGTAGFNVGSLYGAIVTTGIVPITLKYDPTVTYTATGVTLSGTDNTTNYREIKSSSANAGERALLVVTNGTALTNVRVTRVDSSGGAACHTSGTVTDSVNWDNNTGVGFMWLS